MRKPEKVKSEDQSKNSFERTVKWGTTFSIQFDLAFQCGRDFQLASCGIKGRKVQNLISQPTSFELLPIFIQRERDIDVTDSHQRPASK